MSGLVGSSVASRFKADLMICCPEKAGSMMARSIFNGGEFLDGRWFNDNDQLGVSEVTMRDVKESKTIVELSFKETRAELVTLYFSRSISLPRHC